MEALYDVGVSSDQGYVYARAFRAPYTVELALEVAAELARLGQQAGAGGCLVDIRGTTSVSGASDKMDFAYNKTRLASLPLHWRYAFLRDCDDDLSNLVGTFMRDAGYNFRMFENEYEAVEWLEVE